MSAFFQSQEPTIPTPMVDAPPSIRTGLYVPKSSGTVVTNYFPKRMTCISRRSKDTASPIRAAIKELRKTATPFAMEQLSRMLEITIKEEADRKAKKRIVSSLRGKLLRAGIRSSIS